MQDYLEGYRQITWSPLPWSKEPVDIPAYLNLGYRPHPEAKYFRKFGKIPRCMFTYGITKAFVEIGLFKCIHSETYLEERRKELI